MIETWLYQDIKEDTEVTPGKKKVGVKNYLFDVNTDIMVPETEIMRGKKKKGKMISMDNTEIRYPYDDTEFGTYLF